MGEKKTIFSKIIKLLLILFLLIGIGYALLVMAYLIPLDGIKENLGKSYQLLETEGAWRKLIEGHEDTLLDNWTDSTILIETGYEYSQPAYQAALLVPECSVIDNNPTDSFIKLYRQDADVQIAEWNYVNYWHGYLIFMKPLMMFMTYGQIRYLNQFLQTALVGAIIALLGMRKKVWYAIPVILSYVFLNPAVVSMSIQYNTMFLITFIQVLLILIFDNKYKNKELWVYHFFITGCMTSYFDFLTYPIIGYGIPMILLISFYPSDIKEEFLNLIKTGLAWCLGYIGMWAGKWILGTVLTDENILQQAIDRILFRSRGDVSEYTYMDILRRNLELRKDVLVVSILFMLGCVIYLVMKGLKISWIKMIIYLLVMVIPFAWFFAAANHSYFHYFFTYRDLAIVIMGVTCIGIRLIEEAKLTSSTL